MKRLTIALLGLIVLSGCGSSAKSATAPRTDPDPTGKVHVKVELPSKTLRSGTREKGTLVVNNTGVPVTSSFCEIPGESKVGQIELTRTPIQSLPAIRSPSTVVVHGPCIGAEHVVAPAGTSRFTITVEASQTLCQISPAEEPICLPEAQPLAPGRYFIALDSVLPQPTPTEVDVTS